MSTQLPKNKIPAIRVLAMPADTNAAGDIFGGWLMSWVDVAGSIEAIQQVHCRIVTVAVHEFLFIKPVFVGDLVSLYAEIVRIGRTSIRVKVEVFAERNRTATDIEQVCEAELTYVAIDENRNPTPIKQDENNT